MGEIVIMEKPDWITYDDIHQLLYAAHESNREKGFNVETAEMNGEELEKHLGEHGKTLVALDGDKLVGTVSYRVLHRDLWCMKGDVGSYVLLGVLPEYKGQHIAAELTKKAGEELVALGCKCTECRTAEDNEIVQKMCLKKGYVYVDFLSTKTDHYTVHMLRWLGECPYSKFRIGFHYRMRRFLIKLRYKRGRIKRFGL